jgi:hypothetical protein
MGVHSLIRVELHSSSRCSSSLTSSYFFYLFFIALWSFVFPALFISLFLGCARCSFLSLCFIAILLFADLILIVVLNTESEKHRM